MIFTLCWIGNIAYAQTQVQEMKWGKVSPKEWALKQCNYDPQAAAVVLQSVGQITFVKDEPTAIEKHVRIKILKKEGLKWANVTIPYYAKDRYELISNLKAHTINSTPNGSQVIIPLRTSDIFTQKQNKYYKVKKFALPSVKVGSIIEYKYYMKTHSLFNLEAWTFQNEIPTLYSRFKAKVNVAAKYIAIYQGEKLKKNTQKLLEIIGL